MIKQTVFLVLLAVLVFAFTSEAKLKRRCKYVRVCVKAATKCVQHKRVKHCARFANKRVAKKVVRKICLKVTGAKSNNKCLKCAKWGTKTVRKYTTKKVCVKHRFTRSCVKHKNVCVKKATKRTCSIVRRKRRVVGPKKCRSGFTLKFKKAGKIIRRYCKRNPKNPVKPVLKTCNSYLDPHTTGFNKKNFEFQVEGDFLMARTADGVFAVHQRLKRFGGYTGTVGMAVLVNGVDVLEYLGAGRFFLNRKPINVRNGVARKFKNGGSMQKTGNTIVVEAPNGSKAVYTEYGQQANLAVFVPSTLRVRGYCSGKNTKKWMKTSASGLFQDKMKVKYATGAIPKRRFTKQAKKNAKIRCKAAGLKGVRLANCVHDALILRNHPKKRKMIIKIIKTIKKQLRKAKKIHVRKFKKHVRKQARRFINNAKRRKC